MYSVFSNKIIEVSKMLNCCPENEKLSDVYDNVKDKLLYTSLCVTTNSNFLEIDKEDAYEIILQNRVLEHVIHWINLKILTQLKTLESKTLEVRIRIATSMLNSAIQNNNLKPIWGIIMHDNFVKNLKELYFDLQIDELPFQG